MRRDVVSVLRGRVFITICLFFALSSTGYGQDAEAKEKLQTFLEVAEDLFEKTELPGAGISIVYDGNVLYTGGLGYANIANKTPVTENSLFFIGSTTKAFTGFATATLVDEKQLEWKAPVINYIPDFTLTEPYIAKHVNLEDLFTHMTGLSRKDELWIGTSLTRDEVYKQVAELGFDHSFRGEWSYNNHAYAVIGKVLETVAKTSWESLIESTIFKPLGMENSYATHKGFMDDPNHVTGYSRDGKTELAHINTDNIGAAGAISSTPKDIAKWLKMLVNKGSYNGKQLISEDQYDYLTGPKGMSFSDSCTVNYYSIGWGGKQTHGKRTLIHSGAIAGNSARVTVIPDDGFGIFIMTNQRSDYKAILIDYAESIFVHENFERDLKREAEIISENRFVQFQVLLLNYGIDTAKQYHDSLQYKDFEANMLNLGQQLAEAGYLEPALFVFELNVADNPNSFKAYNNYADALSKDGQKKKAIKMYTKSLTVNPENEFALGQLELLLGE